MNAYGVKEMSVAEMRKTDGGCALCVIVVGTIAVGIYALWRALRRAAAAEDQVQ